VPSSTCQALESGREPRGSVRAPALEVLVDVISGVLDAVGCERAVLFGFEAVAAQCVMFAATRPDRVLGLVLYVATACDSRQPDYPWQWSDRSGTRTWMRCSTKGVPDSWHLFKLMAVDQAL